MPNKIKIFDTTLRDGEQSPGFSMNTAEKIQVARQLDKMGVDVIEAGFPVTSKDDFEAVSKIAEIIETAEVCALCRAVESDLQTGFEAIKKAKKPKIHTFIATSPIHMKYKLKMSPDKVKQKAIEAVRFTKSLCNEIVFSPEDASRSEKDFLYEIIEAVIEAGATVINIPDTVGYSTPEEFGKLINDIRQNVRNINGIGLSTHCQNDLGMATANSLAGVLNGADEIQCTINGIGERAGNASLEEVVMAIQTRKDFYGMETMVNTREIYPASKLITVITGVKVQPNKAIVGANAFAHESGIHQDGVLKHRETYEIMRAEDVGLEKNKIVLGKHSGRHALKNRFEELGYSFDQEQLDKLFVDFKSLADKKKEVFDEDLRLLTQQEDSKNLKTDWKLKSLQINCGTIESPTANIELIKIDQQNGNQTVYKASATGDGPVDASYTAVNQLIGIPNKLLEYSVNAVTVGIDAQATVNVKVQIGKNIVTSSDSDTDIITASVKAYIKAFSAKI
jgi:2-isopropylmalate synthase